MKILIAEDKEHVSRLLSDLLRAWGHESVVVHDGQAALEVLQGPDPPRLALLDWLMPGLDGIEVCRLLRQDSASYPYLILITGQGGRQQLLDGLEAGADEFLTKPVDEAELKARLTAARRVVVLQERLRELAMHDDLTGLWNRAAILGVLDRELARSRREKRPVGVILADLDHFKQINDSLGHLAGDRVLRQVAQRMLASLRSYDTVGRYGGEEFLIVLPGCDGAHALALAERLREQMAAEPIEVEGQRLPVTLSLGVAACAEAAKDAQVLLREADVALYAAKHAGRNRAVQWRAPIDS